MSDSVLTIMLAVGTGFLIGAMLLYARGKPWKSLEGSLLFLILGNFTLIKILALVLLLNITTLLVERWLASVMFTCVAVTGGLVFFLILALQSAARKSSQLRSMKDA